MKTFAWYFGQEVTQDELDAGFEAANDFVRQLTVDHVAPGFSTQPTVTQADPTANMSVDVNGPLRARNSAGERIYVAATRTNVPLTGHTLPSAGQEKYATLLVNYAKQTSDERVYTDENGDEATVQYQEADYFVFTWLHGSSASAGNAVRPTDPADGRLIVADVLLTNGQTQILNADISTARLRAASLASGVKGTVGSDWRIGVGEGTATPTGASSKTLWFDRGRFSPMGLRLLEGADPTADAPVLQATNFTAFNTYTWSNVGTDARAGGWTDAGSYLIPSTAADAVKLGAAGAPHSKLFFDIGGTTKAARPWNTLTTEQRDDLDLDEDAAGTVIFNGDTHKPEYWNGTTWLALVVGGEGGEITVQEPVTITQDMLDDGHYILSFTPSNASSVRLYVIDGSMRRYGTHFTVISDGTYVRQVEFSEDLISELEAGDEVTFVYPENTLGGSIGIASHTHRADQVFPNLGTSYSTGLLDGITDLNTFQEVLDKLAADTAADVPFDDTGLDDTVLEGAETVHEALVALEGRTYTAEEVDTVATYTGHLAGAETVEEALGLLDVLDLNQKIAQNSVNLADYTSTGSFATVTGASFTLTVAASRVRIDLSGVLTDMSDGDDINLKFRITGATTANKTLFWNAQSPELPLHQHWLTDPLNAGVHTIDVQVHHGATSNWKLKQGHFSVTEQKSQNTPQTLSGNVKTGAGANLVGVLVEVPLYGLSDTTDASGDYSIAAIPGIANLTVNFSKTGYISQSLLVDLSGGDVVQNAVLLRGSVTGTVTSNAGGAVAGATVEIASLTKSTTTDGSGNYTLTDVPDGTYTIAATNGAHVDYSGSVVVSGNTTKNITMTANTLGGNILSSVTGVLVESAFVSVLSASGVSNGSGNYAMNKVEAGAQTVLASHGAFSTYSGSKSISQGANTHNFSMVPIDVSVIGGSVNGYINEGGQTVSIGRKFTTSRVFQITGIGFFYAVGAFSNSATVYLYDSTGSTLLASGSGTISAGDGFKSVALSSPYLASPGTYFAVVLTGTSPVDGDDIGLSTAGSGAGAAGPFGGFTWLGGFYYSQTAVNPPPAYGGGTFAAYNTLVYVTLKG